MSNDPIISVIMSTYNDKQTIEDCIKSVLNQTFKNWEFIICDDCSNDGTSDILKKYSKIDNRIIFFRNKTNKGIAKSLNTCIEKSRGKYLARMDADDKSIKNRLEKEYNLLENNTDVDIVGTNMIVEGDNGKIGVRKNDRVVTRESFLKGSPFFHPTVMMRKTALETIGGYSPYTYRCEDLELWFRFYKNGKKGLNIEEPLYVYKENFNDLRRRNLRGAIYATRVFLNGYRDLGIPFFKRLVALKPILSWITPNEILNNYHKYKLQGKFK